MFKFIRIVDILKKVSGWALEAIQLRLRIEKEKFESIWHEFKNQIFARDTNPRRLRIHFAEFLTVRIQTNVRETLACFRSVASRKWFSSHCCKCRKSVEREKRPKLKRVCNINGLRQQVICQLPSDSVSTYTMLL